jgi:hypothetical protein
MKHKLAENTEMTHILARSFDEHVTFAVTYRWSPAQVLLLFNK